MQPPQPTDGAPEAPPAPRTPRVHRSRLAFASAVTVAALPILVLDNLPATAEAGEERVEVAAAVLTTEAPTSTTEASTTTEAPTTTVAPTTTEAPTTTTTAPAPTTTAPKRLLAAPAPTTTAPPPPPPAEIPTLSYGDPNDPATWDRLAQCEASGNWAANTGNGYYGGLQFSKGTWDAHGGIAYADYPHRASREQQIAVGKALYGTSGWDAWPGCADRLGYR